MKSIFIPGFNKKKKWNSPMGANTYATHHIKSWFLYGSYHWPQRKTVHLFRSLCSLWKLQCNKYN